MPKISVIMPAYNAEKYIKEAIDSILSQTFQDFELIVLNDCSKDSTEQIILSYTDDRVVYLKNEVNMGVAATLNRGLAVAGGEYIARMDADDISHPERFRKQARYLDAHPEVAVLGSNLECFNDDGVICTGWSVSEPRQMKVDMFFNEILGDVSGFRSIKLSELLRDKLAMAACKAAVKGGMDITQAEVDTLFEMMDGNMGLKCPHGRPVVTKITRTELEKMFKRKL